MCGCIEPLWALLLTGRTARAWAMGVLPGPGRSHAWEQQRRCRSQAALGAPRC